MPRALVTGANRGLGLETCRQLASRGYSVLLTARRRADAEQAAAELSEAGAVRGLTLDVADERSIAEVARVLEREEPLVALVNNAGVAFNRFDESSVAETIDVNYRGAVRVTDALLPRLAEGANVVMVSSGMGELSRVSPALARELLSPSLDRQALDALVQGFLDAVRAGQSLGGWPRSAYSVSKVALNAFTRILSRELAASGRRIKVNAVCPGWVRTRMGGASASRSVELGARGIVWAATLGAGGPSGAFFRDQREIEW